MKTPEVFEMSNTNKQQPFSQHTTMSSPTSDVKPILPHHLPPIDASQTHGKTDKVAGEATTTFRLTKADLAEAVNFDHRTSPALVELLNEKFGGTKGIADALHVDVSTGLKSSKEVALGITHSVSSVFETDEQKANAKKATTIRRESLVKDHAERVAQYGRNFIEVPPPDSILRMIWDTIKEDLLIKILLAGATINLIVGLATHPEEGWVDGFAIFVAVFIVLGVTAGNNYAKEKKFRNLLRLQSDKKCKVLRNGKVEQISSWDVVVGDVLDLIAGDEICADGLYIDGNHVTIDESPLTGETIPVKKNENSPFFFSGCQVSEGSGRVLVTAVGEQSTAGQIQRLLSEKQAALTPLQEKLTVVAEQLGTIGLVAGILTALGLILRWLIHFFVSDQEWSYSLLIPGVLNNVLIGVTMVVVAVPEGLPVAVTISLALSIYKMIRDNCFVRQLAASETMGEATCICTDKTGTLTENRMTVVKFFAGGRYFHGEGSAESDAVAYSPETFSREYRQLLSEGISVNSTCLVKYKENDPLPKFVGSATEGALLVLAGKLGCNYEGYRENVKKVPGYLIEFNSERKKMSLLVESSGPVAGISKPYRAYVKGASEIVLASCNRIIDEKAETVRPFLPKEQSKIADTIEAWAREGLRTIVLAYKDLEELPDMDMESNVPINMDNELVFIGLAGIKDPIRKEVPEAVRLCKSAGMIVRMVTGDNILTATKIAKECGILDDDGVCLEGPQFRAMNEEEKLEVIPKLRVLARSSPQDKFTLVSLLRMQDEVVAVTGDGTNDAPALKAADVGFAMGIAGTQVAMNASDIILLDDNFASIVQATRWGRNVLDGIRKFLQFQLSVNFAAILITFIGSVTNEEGTSPLSTVQLLWINLIMDSFGALGLASDEPSADILNRPPHSRKQQLITREMMEYVGLTTVYQVVAILFVLLKGYVLFGIESNDIDGIHGLVFSTFVLLQITNEIMTRQLKHEYNFFKGFFSNKLFLFMLSIIIVIQVLMVQLAPAFVNTRELSGNEWLGCSMISLIFIPWCISCRFLFRFYHRRWGRLNRVGAQTHKPTIEELADSIKYMERSKSISKASSPVGSKVGSATDVMSQNNNMAGGKYSKTQLSQSGQVHLQHQSL